LSAEGRGNKGVAFSEGIFNVEGYFGGGERIVKRDDDALIRKRGQGNGDKGSNANKKTTYVTLPLPQLEREEDH